MIDQPKNTTASVFIKLDTIVKDIELYALSNDNAQLHSLDNAIGTPLYMLVAGTGCRAKPFGIPVKCNLAGIEAYVIDVRQVTAISAMGGFRITNIPDMETLGLTGLMTAIWDSPDRHLVANIASDLSPIYSTWLSTTISAAFNLDISQRTDVNITAALFYWKQLNIDDNIDKIIGRIAKDLRLEFDKVSTIVDNAGECSTLDEFLVALKGTSGGVILEKLDVPP
jgi:hypothetical protein